MSPKGELSLEQTRVHCNRIDPDALIELAQSELGLSPPSTALCELSWAIAAHCAARGHPGRWQLLEVPSFLEELERAYTSDDLLGLLDMWILLMGWMPAVGLLGEGVQHDYAEQTKSWLLAKVHLGQASAGLLSRLL